VTILDRRLVTRDYGRELLRSLPPMRLDIFGQARNVARGSTLDCRDRTRTVAHGRRDPNPWRHEPEGNQP
jgi:hypothetical protein